MTKGVKIGIGVGLAIGVGLLVFRSVVRKRGWSHNETVANLFNVPYKPLTEGLKRKYSDLEEQQENEATKGGIEFR
jgi:hypothetical protein